jgi:hypothetical protein
MMMRRRSEEGARRTAERRRREDDAPRLKAQVPDLTSLRLELHEHRSGQGIAESMHARPIVIDHAPALFFVPCGDGSCREGGHDITADVLRQLRAGAADFSGEDACRGQVGSAECRRELRWHATAEYRR